MLLLDVFSFGAVYAPTAEVAAFVESRELQGECGRYVALNNNNGDGKDDLGVEKKKKMKKGEQGSEDEKTTMTTTMTTTMLSGTQLAELYLSLRQGCSVKSWCMEHADVVGSIDVRRFITFGVIKGFLYRVHKYALATASIHHKSGSKRLTKANFNRSKQLKEKVGGGEVEVENVDLGKYLDGTHCFDEICTDLMVSEKELTARLKAWGDVQIICR